MADLRAVFNRDVAETYRVDTPLHKAKFYESGAFVTDARLNALLSSGSQTFQVPHINAIDGDLESNYGNTVFTDIAMPRTISGYKTQGRASYLNEGFLESRLESYLIGQSPNQMVASMLDNYWSQQMDNRAIATLTGIRSLDNTAKALTTDISLATATAASKYSIGAYLDAEGTLDESMQETGVVVVHPLVLTQWRKDRLVDRVATADNVGTVEVYNGRRVISSKRGTVIGTGANAKYVTYLMSNGAFAVAFNRGRDDMEVERTAATGNGAGHNVLWTRANTLIHPQGFSFIAEESALTGGTENEALSASWADLQNKANWRMDSDADQIGIRFLITNL